jgi:hypothetical protein
VRRAALKAATHRESERGGASERLERGSKMEFITAVLAGGGTGIAASASVLYAVGSNMRTKVAAEALHYTNKVTATVAEKTAELTEVTREKIKEGGGTSIVENPDGSLSKVDRSKEVVDFRRQISDYEQLGYQKDINPDKGDNPNDGIW